MEAESEKTTPAELTIEDVKNAVAEQDYDTLTLGDDKVAVRCLLRAKVAVKGMILSTGHKYDESEDACREAVIKRALYELFAFTGNESRAREKEDDCELLIATYYGPIITKNDAGSSQGGAAGFMRRPQGSQEWA